MGSEPKYNEVRKFLRQELGYTFKRGGDMNVAAKSAKSIYQQWLFSLKVLEKIHEKRLIVNIDESSFGRSV